VRAGLGMIEAQRAAKERLEAAHGLRLQARISAHTGLVVVATLPHGAPNWIKDRLNSVDRAGTFLDQ